VEPVLDATVPDDLPKLFMKVEDEVAAKVLVSSRRIVFGDYFLLNLRGPLELRFEQHLDGVVNVVVGARKLNEALAATLGRAYGRAHGPGFREVFEYLEATVRVSHLSRINNGHFGYLQAAH
jgi:hypothetical protein